MHERHTSIETITREVGAWNADILAGWEAGLHGKQKVDGVLRERLAPDHLWEPQNEKRLLDWTQGQRAALRYRQWALVREIHFVGQAKSGEVTVKRKGWNVRRERVLLQMEARGCAGDVRVYYFEGSVLVRRVECRI